MRRGPASGSGGVLASVPPRPPTPRPPPSSILSAILGVSFPSLGAAGTCAAASGPSATGVNPTAPRISMAARRENFMIDSVLNRTGNSAYHSRLPPVYPDSQWWGAVRAPASFDPRSEEHTSELQSLRHLVCRLLLEKK